MASFYDELMAQDKAAAPEPTSFYDQLAAQDQERGRLRASVSVAAGITPEQAAAQRRLSLATGLPLEVVKTAEGQAKAMAKYRELDQQSESSPVLRAKLQNPEFTALAQNDGEALSGIEHGLKVLGGTAGRVAAGGTIELGASIFDLSAYINDMIAAGARTVGASSAAGTLGDWANLNRYNAKRARESIDRLLPAPTNNVESGLYSGAQSAGFQLATLPAALEAAGVKGAQAAANVMGAIAGLATGTRTFNEAREKGQSVFDANVTAIPDAIAEFAFERWSNGKLLDDVASKSPLLKMLLHYGGREVIGEEATTLAQNFNQWVRLNPEKTVREFMAEQPDAMIQTAVAALVGAGIQVGAIKGLQKFAESQNNQLVAQDQAAQIQALMRIASGSALLDHDPQTFRDFVQAAAEGTQGAPTSVWVDGTAVVDALNQAGMTQEQAAQLMPSLTAQLQDAIAMNSPVEIPIGELTAGVAGTPLEAALLPHLRTEADGLSLLEAQEAQAQAQVLLRELAQRSIGDAADVVAAQSSTESVRQKVLDQLTAAGYGSQAVREKGARLVADFYTVMAERLGTNPEKLYNDLLPYQVRNQGQTQGALEQFAGPRSETADTNALANAQARLSAGEDAEQVRQDTGWHQGVDGKWRYEINDSDAVLIPKDEFERRAEADPYGVYETTVGDVLQHPRLFAAYPGLRDITVVYEASSQAGGDLHYGASYNASENTITLGNGLTADLMLSGLLHELQHAIQNAEGFAVGGSPNGFIQAGEGIVRSVLERKRAELSEYLGSLATKMMAGEISPNDLTTLAQQKSQELGIKDLEDRLLQITDPEEAYRRLAGEVEARNTQARANMTDEQRKVTPPAATADVPAGNAIVIFNGEEMHNAPPPANSQLNQQTATANSQLNQQTATPNKYQTKYLAGRQLNDLNAEERAQYDALAQPAEGNAPRGTYDINSMTTVLNGTADLSTFLHETGHFFLDALRRMVLTGNATPQVQQMYDDALKGLGVTNEQWEQWHDIYESRGQIPDGMRAAHEKWAETFEAYLFTGKAPTIEMQSLFRTFAAWLKRVYKSIADFTARTGTQLDPDLKSVMDRMLATDEQIAEAEQVAGLLPDLDATSEAQERLNARSMRDLKWAVNARNRMIAALQKEADTLRRAVRREARREVMSHPLYQAWAFLTVRLSEEDKQMLKPEKERKSVDGPVDESIDSLFVAIAKLGGLRRDEVESQWGFDKKERTPTPLFGKPLLRREGGLSIDEMAQRLAEYGYLNTDENGAFDPADFEAAFDSEYRSKPVYAMAFDYQSAQGERRAGDTLNPEQMFGGRFDVTALKDAGVPEEVVQRLQELGMTAKNGLHPDVVSDWFGFDSGLELAGLLADATPMGAEIEGTTDQMMLERHGDLATPEAIKQAALEAVHNQARAKSLATELAAQRDMLGARTPTGEVDAKGRPKTVNVLLAAAKQFAETVIGRRAIKDLKKAENAHVQAERRAAKAWQKATAAADTQAAVQAKQDQVLNNAAVRAAQEAQDKVRKALDLFKRITRGTDEKLVQRGYDPDIANAARLILAAYGIAPAKGETAAEYLEALKRNDPVTYAAVEPSIMGALTAAKPFDTLTVDELEALTDEVKSLWHLARRSRQMEVDGNLMDREDVQTELHDTMVAHGIPTAMPGDSSAITPKETAIRKLLTFVAAATRVENWAQRMGPTFTKYVFQPVKDAADKYRAAKATYIKRFENLLTPIGATLKRGLIEAPELGYTFGKDTGGVGMAEVLHALLHTGNESNKRKLLLGRQWATENADGTLDTGAWDSFVDRLVTKGVLTKAHFDFVQGVWDLLEDTKPLAQKTHRDVFGRYFAEVTADSFVDPFGETRRGGYVPAIVDSRIVSDAASRTLAEEENQSMVYAFPSTSRGFTKARVEYNRPLLLDLRTLAQHIDKVLLFAHLEAPVRDVRRVLTAKDVAYGLNRIDPVAFDNILTPWLNRASRQQVETPTAGDAGLMRILSVARNRAGMGAMFANVANAAQQLTGFSLAAVRVKPTHLMSAAAQMIAHPKQMLADVANASIYMKERLEGEVTNAESAIKAILLDPSVFDRAQTWTNKHAYFVQQAVDNVMGPVIWTAAFNQATAQGQSEKDAVRFADSVIRTTQGSTLPEDVSRIEGGNAFVRMFTQFAGYFNMQANLIGTEMSTVAHDLGVRKGAGKLLYITLLGFLAPAWVAEAIMQVFRGGPDDEDKDGEYLDDWLAAVFGWSTLRGATALVPAVGPVINASVNAWNDKPYDDRLGTAPAISMIEAAVRAPNSVYKAIAEDGSRQKAVRDVASLITMVTGLPAAGVSRPLGYLAGMSDQRINPTSAVDAARGLVVGNASPQSAGR